jgi:hypothetical protein
MSGRAVLVVGLVVGACAVGAPALAIASSSGPPGQSPLPDVRPLAAAASPADNGTTLCDGKALHRTLVRTDDSPHYYTGTDSITQQITTSSSHGWETLVVTFSAEAFADETLAWIQADVTVDGVFAEPYDTASANAFKSGATYADVSMTRCMRVKPGVHKVAVVLTAVGTDGSAWVDDAALRIDQLD